MDEKPNGRVSISDVLAAVHYSEQRIMASVAEMKADVADLKTDVSELQQAAAATKAQADQRQAMLKALVGERKSIAGIIMAVLAIVAWALLGEPLP